MDCLLLQVPTAGFSDSCLCDSIPHSRWKSELRSAAQGQCLALRAGSVPISWTYIYRSPGDWPSLPSLRVGSQGRAIHMYPPRPPPPNPSAPHTHSVPHSKHWFTTSFLQPLPYLVTPLFPENCRLTSSFFVGAQTVVSLLQTTQIKQGVSFIPANKVYTGTNKNTIVWIVETELFFFLFLFSSNFLQTLPGLVTPLKGYSLSTRRCPATRSASSERFGY